MKYLQDIANYEYMIDDKIILYIPVHESSMVHKTNNIVYDRNIDVRNKIARELCSNILMHREFSNPYPAKLVIEKNKMWTENANKAKRIGNIDIKAFSPYPKNPKIAKFFKEIGLADELGSGVKNMVKYTKIYSGGIPEFKENDIFTTIIPLNATVNALVNEPVNAPVKLSNTQKLIIKLMKQNNQITQIELSKELEVNESTIKRNISKLKSKGILIRLGSDKNGYWKILR